MGPQDPYPANIYAGSQYSTSAYAPPYSANASMGPSYSINTSADLQNHLYSTNTHLGVQGLPYSANANIGAHGAHLGQHGPLYFATVGPQDPSYFPTIHLGSQGPVYSTNVNMGLQGPPYPTNTFVDTLLHTDSTVANYSGPSPYTKHLVHTFNNDFIQPFWELPATLGHAIPASLSATTALGVHHSTSSTRQSFVGNLSHNPTSLSVSTSTKELHFFQCCEFFPFIISLIEKVCILAAFKGQLTKYGLRNWLSAITAVSEILCTLLREMTLPYISSDVATRAMAEGIFKCVRRSPNYDLQLENSKYWKRLLPNISCHGAAEWNYKQFIDKETRLKHQVMHQLCEVFLCFNGHLLYQAKFLVMNQNTFGGPSKFNGIYDANTLPSKALADWWCTFSDDYSFGIYHLMKQNKMMGQCVMVSLYCCYFEVLDYVILLWFRWFYLAMTHWLKLSA